MDGISSGSQRSAPVGNFRAKLCSLLGQHLARSHPQLLQALLHLWLGEHSLLPERIRWVLAAWTCSRAACLGSPKL
jgi:hypothetical protein